MTEQSHVARRILELLCEVYPEPLTTSVLAEYHHALRGDDDRRFSIVLAELLDSGCATIPEPGFVVAVDPG